MNKQHLLKQLNLREKVLFLRPLFLAVLLFLFSVFFDNVSENFSIDENHGINVDKIEKVLHRKENKISSLLTKLSKDFTALDNKVLIEGKLPGNKYDSLFFNDQYLKIRDEHINILVYKNDSLKFWTSNSIPLNLRYSESYLGDRVVDLENAIYRVIIQKKARYIFVGLILIKHTYPLQNKLLHNTFYHEFDLNPDVSISLLKETPGVKIKDRYGNYLFTLSPDKVPITEKPFFYTSVVFYLLSVIVFLFFLNNLIARLFHFRKKDSWLLFLIIILLYAKYLLTYYQYPLTIYNTDLYNADIFGYSDFLPSISEMLQLAIVIFLISFNFIKQVKTEKFSRYILALSRKKKSIPAKLSKPLFVFGFPVLLGVFYFRVLRLIYILIAHSIIPFDVYKILNLSVYSFVGIVIIGLLLSSFVIVLYKYVLISSRLVQIKGFLYACVVLFLTFLTFDFSSSGEFDILPYIYLFVILGLFVFVRFTKLFYPYYFYILVLFISTFFIVLFLDKHVNAKDLKVRNTLIIPAIEEQDPIAEHILYELDPILKKDSKIIEIIFEEENPNEQLKNYLYKKHYPELWEEYDMDIKIKTETDSISDNILTQSYFDYYRKILEEQGSRIVKTNFHFLDNQNGRITYLGNYEYQKKEQKLKVFLELNSKLRSKVIGFPLVLLDKDRYRKSRLEEYSYAKYINNRLVNQKGNFDYKYHLDDYKIKNTDSSLFKADNFQHLIISNPEGYSVIISKKSKTTLDLIVNISYIFVLYYIILNILLVVNQIPFYYKELRHGLKFRIQFSMVAILFLSILTVGGLSIYYIIKQSENNYFKKVKTDLTAVINELEYKFDNEYKLSSVPNDELYDAIKQISIIFSTEIHLYSRKGDLIVSSAPEIFEKKLLGKKIDPYAYQSFKIEGDNFFHNNEKIGKLEYLSAYAKLSNINNETLAYVNMSFFTKEKILQEEVSNFVVSVINIFALLLLIAIVIAIFISNKIVQPLRLVQSKFSEVQLGKTNEQILYSKDDEIGGLIKEYNRMLVELSKSAQKLGKSEREGAWREMAKQIAHEIKNPLTPMKLNLQLLKKSWHDKDPDFPLRIENVSNTLIQQIDRLSAIATSFSNFAKIPLAKNKKFDLTKTLEGVMQLFENLEDLTISSNMKNIFEPIYIYADEEQISRAIINLIKNAHQAKKEEVNSFIYIELLKNPERVVLKITDNGTGIPDELKEKLFRPNFTTKTSGMGLGLSIVKNIIENSQGKIWFVTELNVGTSFYIQFPLYSEENII